MPEIDVNRHSHLIDPHMHVWGWQVPVYLFLGGVVAGLMVFCALLAMRQATDQRSKWGRWLAFLAPVLLSIGMLALLLDLEYKFHVWRFYAALKVTSPMSWGSWILLLIYPATLAIGFASLTGDEITRLAEWGPLNRFGLPAVLRTVHRWGSTNVRFLAWANVVLGIALGIYTGILLGSLGEARPAWNSALLGPLFLVSGISTGAAFMMLFPLQHDEHTFIQRWDIGAILLELMLLFLLLTTLMTGGGLPGRQAARLFLGGDYTALFWSLVVVLGLAVPLGLEVIEIVRRRRPALIAPVLLLIGGLALRWIIVAAGQV